ncbi:MAG TPA: BrnA antitoxin family protein [Allosphingosinicella sp.]
MADRTSRFEGEPDDEIVEFDESFFENARVVIGGKVIREASGTSMRRGRPPKPEGERKVLVSLRLAPDIIEWFRSTGPGWQTRIEELLRREIAADPKTD